MTNKTTTATTYRRALAASNETFGWSEVPDCPMEIFARIIAKRAQGHPEMDTPTIELRARVFNEAAWKSDKVLNIQPAEWIPEYAWLYSIALVDGTFEASPRLIWMAAYAGRAAWDTSKVGQLLDELERVGLLVRAKDDTGKVWGRWVGSEKFLPSKAHVDSHRYKKGRSDLFAVQSSAALDNPEQRQNSAGMSRLGLGLDSGVGVGSELEKESGVDVGFGFDSAAKGSEKEQSNPNPKSECVFSSSTPTPKPTTKATATPTPKKQVLSPDEYRTAKAVANFAAELATREPCPGCGVKHSPPFCAKNSAVVTP